MKDPLIVKFAEACGTTAPLNLRVDLPERGVLAEGSVAQSFTLIGRDDACDVTLSDPEVNLRHAWLQTVSGRLFAVDLGSRTGLGWDRGGSGSGWMDVDSPVRIGPFRINLLSPVGEAAPPARPGPSPLQPDPHSLKHHPGVVLDFRNGRRAKDRWSVNRSITLVGRSPDCKIHLHTDDISAFHCGLVYTPSGLWVVDLSGQGVVVNGERMRVAPLPHGAELWVGRFLIGCHYPELGMTPATGHPAVSSTLLPSGGSDPGNSSSVMSSIHLGGSSPVRRAVALKPAASPDDDEVALGIQPPCDPAAGLPSSHIMADAFAAFVPGGSMGFTNGPISNAGPLSPRRQANADSQSPLVAANPALAEVLTQMGEVHAQMFDQFQQSMMLMMQMFGQLHRDQMSAMRKELGHIHELNGEMAKLQAEVARVTFAQACGKPAPVRSSSSRIPHASLTSTPLPDQTLTGLSNPSSHSNMAAAAIQDWVVERIGVLQVERKTRWDKLAGLLAEAPKA